jgi:hypothetical protein
VTIEILSTTAIVARESGGPAAGLWSILIAPAALRPAPVSCLRQRLQVSRVS